MTEATQAPAARRRISPGRVVGAVVLVLAMLVAVLPLVFMVIVSFEKTTTPTIHWDSALLTTENYVALFRDNAYFPAIITSVIVVVIACALNLVVCSLAAFAFEKKKFPGSEALFWVYIATMMVPGQVTLIPLYNIMRELGLLNTHIALALPLVNAFGVFLVRQFMAGIPDDLMEAARIDGARDKRIFFSLIVPLIRPVLVALTVFTFLSTWNDFLWPLVSVSNDEMQTVTLAAANLQGRFTTDYGLVMAGSTIALAVPLLVYAVLQRQFVEGVVASGLKG